MREIMVDQTWQGVVLNSIIGLRIMLRLIINSLGRTTLGLGASLQKTRQGVRLDHLCNIELRFRFQGYGVEHLVRSQSDHAPILISTFGFSARIGETKHFWL